MDFALQAALSGAAMGAAVLAACVVYGWMLAAAPAAYGWWAGAFVLLAAGKALPLFGSTPLFLEASDFLYGFSAGLIFGGAISVMGGQVPRWLPLVALGVGGGWAELMKAVRPMLELPPLPVLGIGGIALLVCGWAFLHPAALGGRRYRLASSCFAISGVHELVSPLLLHHSTTSTWSFLFSQFMSMLTALALLLVVLRQHQAVAQSEGLRADMLQNRLVDALGSVEDAVAVYDSGNHLLTCNSHYRAFLAPIEDIIQPGRHLADILAAELRTGTVLSEAGRDEWVRGLMAEQMGAEAQGREFQLWNGRWVALNVYRTNDGGHLRVLRDISTRKQAELSLKESVSWLRGIMDTVIDAIITIDDTGTVLSFNPAAERIFGYDSADVVGRNVRMLMPEPFHSEHDSYIERYVESRDPRLIGIGRQSKGRRKDGSVFPLDLAVTEMRQGDMVTFIGVIRDITDRKRVEEALVDSEQRFRDLAESSTDWFWELDANLRFTFVSDRVRQVLGVGVSHFLGRSFDEVGMASEDAATREFQFGLIRGRRPFRGFVFAFSGRDGADGALYVEMSGRPTFDQTGDFTGYRGTATDITQLKRQGQELEAQSTLRQAIIDNMAQGVAVFDGEEVLVALNRQARILLDLPGTEIFPGVANLELVVLHLAVQGEFGPGRVAGKVERRLARLRGFPDQNFLHSRPNGQTLEIRSTAMPGGGLILTMADVTERKKAEDTLREAKDAAERGNRAKATFLANISHELRTPLNAIIGFSELMKHEIFGPLEPGAYRGYVDDIHESGMHLLELINDILDMSKAEAGMTDLQNSSVDVAVLVQSSVRLMSRRAEEGGVRLETNLPATLPHLLGDERRLRQIILNLVSNAVKFTDTGGMVSVVAWTAEDGFHLDVRDTGIGMTAEELVQVMEPFVQADSRLSRKYEGTGLGLPLANALVAAHGGSLSLTSKVGQGTIASVVFPASRILSH